MSLQCLEKLSLYEPSSYLPRAAAAAKLTMRRSAGGAWIVSDAGSRRGGYFRDLQSLLRYVRREFGQAAELRLLEAAAAMAA